MKKLKKILKAFIEVIKVFSTAIGISILIMIPFVLITWALLILFKNQWIVLGILGFVVIVGLTWEFYNFTN